MAVRQGDTKQEYFDTSLSLLSTIVFVLLAICGRNMRGQGLEKVGRILVFLPRCRSGVGDPTWLIITFGPHPYFPVSFLPSTTSLWLLTVSSYACLYNDVQCIRDPSCGFPRSCSGNNSSRRRRRHNRARCKSGMWNISILSLPSPSSSIDQGFCLIIYLRFSMTMTMTPTQLLEM